ncbi:MAG TPA: hypothetical protein DEV93_19780 [Chloroflexi bacterium]|jgi:uncharacterized protein involved in oxidation of intracellular sulfur|nr:hypothetical protein [Chloroflexota bacterium]
MRYLLILNDPAYGTERSYNGFRLAGSLAGQEGAEVRVFLIGDAVTCALAGQKTPNGYYNLERMVRSSASKGARVGCCGSCLDARGIADDRLAEGACRSSVEELTEWTVWAEKVITF